jgi:hypothetical protein
MEKSLDLISYLHIKGLVVYTRSFQYHQSVRGKPLISGNATLQESKHD